MPSSHDAPPRMPRGTFLDPGYSIYDAFNVDAAGEVSHSPFPFRDHTLGSTARAVGTSMLAESLQRSRNRQSASAQAPTAEGKLILNGKRVADEPGLRG